MGKGIETGHETSSVEAWRQTWRGMVTHGKSDGFRAMNGGVCPRPGYWRWPTDSTRLIFASQPLKTRFDYFYKNRWNVVTNIIFTLNINATFLNPFISQRNIISRYNRTKTRGFQNKIRAKITFLPFSARGEHLYFRICVEHEQSLSSFELLHLWENNQLVLPSASGSTC